ncbi:hypothetical protein AAFC00_004290 [Neodothiora populina]|uniref:DUF7708 domain-containing protein n=1 Tax=Neodothiora populina TaxID=2781224 RepID=A0ABR3PJI8_9PEZI
MARESSATAERESHSLVTHERQLQLIQSIRSSKSSQEVEKQAAECDSLSKLESFLQDVERSKGDFDSRQQNGSRKWLRKYQETAIDMQNIMDGMNPFIDCVQTFAPAPAGAAIGATIGTFAVLLAVAKSKNDIERRLASTISGIIARLPGIKLYHLIYSDQDELDQRLQISVLAAYDAFADFCIEAINYYRGHGRDMWSRAVKKPHSFKDQAQRVQNLLKEIQTIIEALIHKKLHKIEESNKKLQEQNDVHRLELVQQIMRLETFSEDKRKKEFITYRDDLNDKQDPIQSEPMDEQTMNRFETQAVYQDWLTGQQPFQLILSADNHNKYSRHCWVSPFALRTIGKLQSKIDDKSLFAYCLLSESSKRLVEDTMGVIIFQLLRQDSTVLRDQKQYNELYAELQEYRALRDGDVEENTMKDNTRFSALEKVVLRVLSLFDESKVIHIVVDRADLCREDEQDHCRKLMRLLVRMVHKARCRLKILAVVNKADWAIENDRDDLEDRGQGRVIIHTMVQRGRFNGVDL